MELQTVSTVSKTYGVSTRMLRYYEQSGLIKSMRKEGYSYRVYDEANLKRLQQVIILRKLQIPIKQIYVILNNPDAREVVEIFKRNIQELDSEITALSTIKIILDKFVDEIEKIVSLDLNLDFINGNSVLEMTRSLSLVQKNVKESITMRKLLKAADVLNKLENVRVVYVPPMTVASICYNESGKEEEAWQALNDFVIKHNLTTIKPDLRVFKLGAETVSENWVSIPDDFEVPAPFTKKKFNGGQYVSHLYGGLNAVNTTDESGMEIWLGLQDWINGSDKYQYDTSLDRCEPPIKEIESFGGIRLDLEEVLNYHDGQSLSLDSQIDIMLPIKKYEISDEALIEIPGSKEQCGFKANIVTKNKFRIMGFTQVISGDVSVDGFIEEVRHDGRLDILNKYRKPGAPILGFSSHDLDSQLRGGWRYTICLEESDITDVQAFKKHNLYIEKIDASRWLIFEYTKGDEFNDHAICPKLGFTWNGVISGSFTATPDGKIWKPQNEEEMKSTIYCWYPVK